MSEDDCAHRHRLRHDGGRAGHRHHRARRDGHRQHRPRRRRCAPACSAATRPIGSGPAPASPAPRSRARSRSSTRRCARHRRQATDPFDLLRRLGGRELAAIAGAIMAARLARVPVVLDGYACTAAAAVLFAADPRALDHCLVAHRSAEPGHRAAARAARQDAAARSRHAARRSLGRDAGDRHSQSGARLPYRHGDLRRGRASAAPRTSALHHPKGSAFRPEVPRTSRQAQSRRCFLPST